MATQAGRKDLAREWASRWPEALEVWSRFTKLSTPRWCFSTKDEKREALTSSFAMIRLDDHAVVISFRLVQELGIEGYPLEVMCHEIGHHVYCPADLADQGRLIARIRRALPSKEHVAPLVANLYTDLLINDRLQRDAKLRMNELYAKIAQGGAEDGLWRFYTRIYEILWHLDKGSLSGGEITKGIDVDASLGARVIRSYAKDWLRGAGRFAMLCFPYLAENEGAGLRTILRGWLDAEKSASGSIPDGLAEIEDDEEEGAVHPALDPDLGGVAPEEIGLPELASETGDTMPRRRYREPFEYREILNSLGVEASAEEMTIRYYRERAVPHLVPFPVRLLPASIDPLPEGLEVWDSSDALDELDVLESLMRSDRIIPGVTTVQRTWGVSPGHDPETLPVDLYVGVDCSGSMRNPAHATSYPVLAGTIIALSALRAGARVMVCLSGEPGSYSATDGFVRDERQILGVLTGYLGTGYAFGIHRLKHAFENRTPTARPAHILIVTDHDIFAMLGEKHDGMDGWTRAETSLSAAGGGGTYVLHMPPGWDDAKVERMRGQGWGVHFVTDWEHIIAFAREFARATYGRSERGPREERR
jgi:hypothetical protein